MHISSFTNANDHIYWINVIAVRPTHLPIPFCYSVEQVKTEALGTHYVACKIHMNMKICRMNEAEFAIGLNIEI